MGIVLRCFSGHGKLGVLGHLFGVCIAPRRYYSEDIRIRSQYIRLRRWILASTASRVHRDISLDLFSLTTAALPI